MHINFTGEVRSRDISLSKALRPEDGHYLTYDYFADKFLGSTDKGIYLDVEKIRYKSARNKKSNLHSAAAQHLNISYAGRRRDKRCDMA